MKITRGERLKTARVRFFSSGRAAALAMELPPATYGAHERAESPGGRDFAAGEALRYARQFHVSAEWLMFGTGKGPTNLPSDPSIDTYSLDELLSLAEGTGTLADAQVLLFGKIRNSAQKLLRKSRSKSKFESRSDKLPEHVAQVLDKTIRRIEAARSSNERIITELRGILVSLKKPTPRKR